MYELFDWHRYGRLFFALSVLLRTESVCLYIYIIYMFISYSHGILLYYDKHYYECTQ